MKDLFDSIPIWLEAKTDICLLGRYNTLNGIEKGEKVLLSNITVDIIGFEAPYDITFLAKRYKTVDRSLWEHEFKAMTQPREVLIEGSFYVEDREEFDHYFKVIKQGE